MIIDILDALDVVRIRSGNRILMSSQVAILSITSIHTYNFV